MSETNAETTVPATTHLTAEQLTRAEALGEARRVLAARGMLASSAVDVVDVHSLARYIVEGGDPWRPYSSRFPEIELESRPRWRWAGVAAIVLLMVAVAVMGVIAVTTA